MRTSSGMFEMLTKKNAWNNLRDDLMRADEQHHFPFRPVTDAIDLAEDNAEEKNLAEKPKHLDDQPENEVCLEAHFANERVAQHDRVNFDVTAHPSHRFHRFPADGNSVAEFHPRLESDALSSCSNPLGAGSAGHPCVPDCRLRFRLIILARDFPPALQRLLS